MENDMTRGLLLTVYGDIQMFQQNHHGKLPDKIFMNYAMQREISLRANAWQVAGIKPSGEVCSIFGVPVQGYIAESEGSIELPEFYIAERGFGFSPDIARATQKLAYQSNITMKTIASSAELSKYVGTMTAEFKELEDGK